MKAPKLPYPDQFTPWNPLYQISMTLIPRKDWSDEVNAKARAAHNRRKLKAAMFVNGLIWTYAPTPL